MMTHWLLAAGFAGMAVAIFFLGWSARIMRVEWRDDKQLRAAEARAERHTHRKGDPLPTAGRLSLERLADPTPLPGEPPFFFAGESEPGWAAESAEYELLTQTRPDPEPEPELTDTGEMRALSAAWIEKMQGDSNEWIFTHLMRTSDG